MGEIKQNKSAFNSFLSQLGFIEKRNPFNAIKVRNQILDEIDLLLINPKAHILDKYKLNNNDNYRVILIFEYRITYKIQNSDILIVRFRHMKKSEKYH